MGYIIIIMLARNRSHVCLEMLDTPQFCDEQIYAVSKGNQKNLLLVIFWVRLVWGGGGGFPIMLGLKA